MLMVKCQPHLNIKFQLTVIESPVYKNGSKEVKKNQQQTASMTICTKPVALFTRKTRGAGLL